MRKTISPILMFLLTLVGGVTVWAQTSTWYSPGSRLSIEKIGVGTNVFIYSMCRVYGNGSNYSRFIVSNGDAAGTFNATPVSLLTKSTSAIWQVASKEKVQSDGKTGYQVTFKRNKGADGFLGLDGTTNATTAGNAHKMVVTQWKSDPYVSGTTKSGTDVYYEDEHGTPVQQSSMQDTDPIYLVSSLSVKSLNTANGSFNTDKGNGYPVVFYSVDEQTVSINPFTQVAVTNADGWLSNVKWLRMKINSASWSYVETGSLYRDTQGLTIDHPNASGNLSALWAIAGTEENGYKFYNLHAGPSKVLGMTGTEAGARVNMVDATNPGEGVTTTFDIKYHDEQNYWYIKKHGDNNDYVNCRRPYIAHWGTSLALGNSGSSFMFELVDLNVFVNAEKTATLSLIEDWTRVSDFWSEATDHYNAINNATLSSSITNTELTTYSAAVRAASESFLRLDGTRFTATNQADNARRGSKMYFDASTTQFKGRNPSTYTQDEVMTLKPNDNFTFKIYNAATDKYIGTPTGWASGSTSAVALSNAANFDLYTSGLNNNVVVFCVNGTATMHLLNDFSISAYSSTSDVASCWLLGQEFSRYNLKSALAIPELIGPGIGHYTYTGDNANYQQTISSAQSVLSNAEATDDQIQASIEAMNTISQNTSINQPEVNKLYRFKGKVSGKYMASPSNNASKMTLKATSANGAETVFLLQENGSGEKILLSFGNGYYVKDTHTANAQKAYANTISFNKAESGNPGYYTLKTNHTSPYMYDDNDQTEVDRNTTYAANYCDWKIEEVQWLPIPVTNGYSKLGTFVSPVALIRDASRLKFYTGTIQTDSYFHVKEFTENVIPAGVPFLIEYQDGSEYVNSCSYVEVSSGTASLGEGVTNHLQGGLETVATPGEIYTLQKTGSDPETHKQEFWRYTGDFIKGFRAYLPVPTGGNIRGMIFGGTTTDIEGATTEETAAPVIYDLSGRRVQRATKGMYIVNGKKMYVK